MQQKKGTMILAGSVLLSGMLISSVAAAAPDAAMLSNTCAGCHGTDGISAGPAMPTIAGMPAKHIKTVMMQFKKVGLTKAAKKCAKDAEAAAKDGKPAVDCSAKDAALKAMDAEEVRHATIMDRISAGYSEEEIDAIAKFYAEKKWQDAHGNPNSVMASKVDANLAKKGAKEAKKCEKCHEENGKVQDAEAGIPRMAGQWLDYLLIKMADYKNEALKGHIPQEKKMASQMEEKSAEDLTAIAHFYANEK